jgi:hypothetical protein
VIEEEWRPVVGYEGAYEVSSVGGVRSLDRWIDQRDNQGRPISKFYAGKVLTQKLTKVGYLTVGLSSLGKVQWFLVQRLVCVAFHGDPPTGAEAAHGDGNRTNNAVPNLRWASKAENAADRIRHGRGNQGEGHFARLLTDEAVSEIRALTWAKRDGERTRRLAEHYGISVSHFLAIRRNDGKRWRHV